MSKIKKDEFLDKISPDDIENVILPILKEEKKRKIAKQSCIIERKFSYKRLLMLLMAVFMFGLLLYSGYKIFLWKSDSNSTYSQIELINKVVKIEEVEDNENTEIINPPEEVDEENPYWDYIKMNLINVDFTELLKINNDTKGWLQVNGTNINYPFVQTIDNEYYLKRDYNKKYNSAGWVFLDYRNDMTNLNKNTILYAHGRVDKTMFGSLKNIFKSDWFDNKDNHVIKLSTQFENTLWQVFSVYHIPTTSDYLKVNFDSNEEFMDFVNMLKSRSQYDFNVSFNGEDKILTLSTCYNEEERVVLHAKLIKRETR